MMMGLILWLTSVGELLPSLLGAVSSIKLINVYDILWTFNPNFSSDFRSPLGDLFLKNGLLFIEKSPFVCNMPTHGHSVPHEQL